MSEKLNSKDIISQIANQKEWTKNPDGSLTLPVVVISEEVLDYPEFGTSEYISDDIYKPEFLNQIQGLPFVLEHPTQAGEPVDVKSDNFAKFIKGTCFDPEAQPDKKRVVANCRVYDKDVVSAIEAGEIKELSAKYQSNDVHENGEFDGKNYNVKQTQMVLNHLALTEAGRAGDRVKVLISKQNSKGENMEDMDKKPDDEKENQDVEGTSQDDGLTLEAVNKKVEGLTELVQALYDKMPSETQNADPEKSEEDDKDKEKYMMDMVKENSLSVKDMESFVNERDRMIEDAKELIGNDVHLMMPKLNSMDAVRRYALVKSGHYDEESIKGLTQDGAKEALHLAARFQKKMNSQKSNSEPLYSMDSGSSFFEDAKENRA